MKHVLVIGSGSVGKRHMQNLQAQGCHISAVDPRADRLAEAAALVNIEHEFASLDEVGGFWGEVDGVVIATPPVYHVEQCIVALEQSKPILLEKPLTTDLQEGKKLFECVRATHDSQVLLGYTYRWWPPLREFRRQLADVAIGRPLHAKFVMSAHLADWHPWERYQDFFMASKQLGGGALLDESHFLDLMLWFFGPPSAVFSKVEKISGLEIDTDDNVDVIASYSDGLRVCIHLDLYGRPHEKYITVTGDEGTLDWRFEPNCIRRCTASEHDWNEEHYSCERNDMFKALAADFVAMLNGANNTVCTVGDGMDVLRLVEACRESTRSGQEIALDPALFTDTYVAG